MLTSMSTALDFVEMDYLGVTLNHSKRVAYIALQIGRELGLDDTHCLDLITFSMLHNNGSVKANEKITYQTIKTEKQVQKLQDYCRTGEKNIRGYPFFHHYENVIQYHLEQFNGQGLFGIQGQDIPVFSQIIYFAHCLDNEFNLPHVTELDKKDITDYCKRNIDRLFSHRIVASFMAVQQSTYFWLDLKDLFIQQALERSSPFVKQDWSWQKIYKASTVYRNIIDSKLYGIKDQTLSLCDITDRMCSYYQKGRIETLQIKIAANLQDIGMLAVSQEVLNKQVGLKEEEILEVKKHVYYTQACLERIRDFQDISKWACNHHENLRGNGYPYKKSRQALDFNSRLLACLDKYTAITQDRPYRKAYSPKHAIQILRKMALNDKIDKAIVEDMAYVFDQT